MAGIPVGMDYTTTLEGTHATPYACRACPFQGVAMVRAKGKGEASATFFIGMGAAKERSRGEAQSDLRKNVELLAAAGTCPRCKKSYRADLDAVRSNALGLSAFITLGGTAFIGLTTQRFNLALVFVVSFVAGVANYLNRRWLWDEVDARVKVMSQAEAQALEATSSAEGGAAPERWVLCPLWKAGHEDVISEPFVGTLRLGLLSVEDGKDTWLEPADVPVDAPEALARARLNLKARSAKPLRQVEPGVWQAEWDDWFAAARLAVPEVLGPLPTKGAAIAFTPSENTLIIAGEDDPRALERAAHLAAHHAREVISGRSVAGAFTARPWKLEGQRFVRWHPAPDVEPLLRPLEAVVGEEGWR